MADVIGRYFPEGTRVTRPKGGFVLWLEMPEQVDSIRLFDLAHRRGISIAPGPLFSASGKYRNFVRLNAGFYSEKMETVIATLGSLAGDLASEKSSKPGVLRPKN